MSKEKRKGVVSGWVNTETRSWLNEVAAAREVSVSTLVAEILESVADDDRIAHAETKGGK